MKKYKLLLVVSFLFLGNSIFAQQLQNPSFDSVYIGGIDRLWDWVSSDAVFMGGNVSNDTVHAQQANTLFPMAHEIFGHVDIYSTTPYSSVCVKLNATDYKKNYGAPYETFVVNGHHYYTGADGYIDFSRCGSPFAFRPDTLRGFYQFIDSSSASLDYGHCIVLLKKYNTALNKIDTIAYTQDSLSFQPINWKSFSVPITYLSSDVPDSIVVLFKNGTKLHEGTSFFIDQLSFVYNTTPNATIDFDKESELPIVYPNPNLGVIYVKENGYQLTHYRLLNVNGGTIIKGDFKSEIYISKKNEGILFLELFDKNGLVTRTNIYRQ